MQIKAIIQIPVKITETLAVSKAAGQKIGKWTGNYIRQIEMFNFFFFFLEFILDRKLATKSEIHNIH